MRTAIAALVLVATASPAGAIGAFACPTEGQTIVVSIGALTKDGYVYNCIDADFVEPLTPCGMLDRWVLYKDGFGAEIVDDVAKKEDFANHTGGVLWHEIDGHEMIFTGGYTSPDIGYVEVWSFTSNEVTSEGVLRTGTTETRYACVGFAPQ